jgi:predicted peptidase
MFFCKKYDMIPFKETIDGNAVGGFLFTPKKNPNGRIIIYCHGSFSLAKENQVESYSDVVNYVESGFIVFVLKYDKDSVQGMKEATTLLDAKEAYDAARIFKRRLPKAKIYLVGASRGSWVAQNTMIEYSPMFDGGIYLVGPTNLPTLGEYFRKNKIFPDVTIGDKIGMDLIWPYFNYKNDEVLSSTTTYATKLNAKSMLLIYGQQDIVIPQEQGLKLAELCCLVLGKNFFLVKGGHGLGNTSGTVNLIKTWILSQ